MIKILVSFIFIVLVNFGCGGSPDVLLTIGGTLTGLSGTIVLQNNGADDLTLTGDGSFTFATGVGDGGSYTVAVLTQPSGQTCTVANGSGTVSGANVTHVTVSCSSIAYTVGGTISGLSGTVVLQNNSGDDLTITADGSFTFLTAVVDGDGYEVTITAQPSDQTCSLASGVGIISGANVTNVVVVCSTDSYTVGGTIAGLSGTVVLQNNSGDDLTITTDGSLTFLTPVADGATYAVTVKTQPSGVTCSVANETGTISGANITNVTVTCAANTYTVGGTLSGLSGTVVLQNNSGNSLSKTTNGSFTFSSALLDGASYSATVSSQPSGQTCTVSNGSGTVSGANVTNVTVVCVDNNKIVFVTSVAYADGNLGGLSGADTKCNTLASAAGLSGTYSAWLSTGSVNAKDHVSIGHAGGFLLVNGTTVANNFADLLDGTIQNPITRDESGVAQSVNTMTGTLVDGTAHATNLCSNWTSASSGSSGQWGAATASVTDSRWTNIFSNTCATGGAHLYCFQN